MAPRVRSVTSGGANNAYITKITTTASASTVSVLPTDGFFFDQTKKTTVGGGVVTGFSGEKLVFESDKNNEALTTWLKANQVKEPDAAPTYRYENADLLNYATGSVSSLLLINIGPYTYGKRLVQIAPVVVSAGDSDYEYNTVTVKTLTFTTQTWNGSADLVIPVALWDLIVKMDGTTKIIDKTDSVLAVPYALTVGKASDELWVKALA